jgi:hypothetical protein
MISGLEQPHTVAAVVPIGPVFIDYDDEGKRYRLAVAVTDRFLDI